VPAYHRTVTAHVEAGPAGTARSIARVDDWFHGFEVVLDLRDGQLVQADASAHRHPWTTCPGALASVKRLDGAAASLEHAILSAPRSTTCVHVNDLVALAARQHANRHYEMFVTPREAQLRRDGEPALSWRLRDWTIDGTGALAGLGMTDPRWHERLDAIDASADLREAIKVLRRGALVAIGYYALDWSRIEVGKDIPAEVMAGTCHTFTEPTVSNAIKLATVPDRRARPR
jgi:hypothetical protein